MLAALALCRQHNASAVSIMQNSVQTCKIFSGYLKKVTNILFQINLCRHLMIQVEIKQSITFSHSPGSLIFPYYLFIFTFCKFFFSFFSSHCLHFATPKHHPLHPLYPLHTNLCTHLYQNLKCDTQISPPLPPYPQKISANYVKNPQIF